MVTTRRPRSRLPVLPGDRSTEFECLSKCKAGGLRHPRFCFSGLDIRLIQRTANRQVASIENVGIDHGGFHVLVKEDVAFDPADVCLLGANGTVFEADGVTDTSTSLRQAQDMAQCRPDRGVSWVLVPSGFPPVLTGCGCSAIMPGKVTMGIRQKSAHGVIIQEDFRKCNPVDCLGGFRLRNSWAVKAVNYHYHRRTK